MKILENEIINKDSLNFFYKKLDFFCQDKKFKKELSNTKILYETFYNTSAPISNIEKLLEKELKLHLYFYHSSDKEFINKFKNLPFIVKVLLLKFCEKKKLFSYILKKTDKINCLKKIEEIKKNIGVKIMDFSSNGNVNTFIPLKTFIVLIQYNCFDITKQSEQMILEFFSKYLSNEEIKKQFKNKFLYNYYCDVLFSSKTYKDFNTLYNVNNYIKKINSKDLSFIKQNKIEQIDLNNETINNLLNG